MTYALSQHVLTNELKSTAAYAEVSARARLLACAWVIVDNTALHYACTFVYIIEVLLFCLDEHGRPQEFL